MPTFVKHAFNRPLFIAALVIVGVEIIGGTTLAADPAPSKCVVRCHTRWCNAKGRSAPGT